jgi:hypothetical protein
LLIFRKTLATAFDSCTLRSRFRKFPALHSISIFLRCCERGPP